ncbi:MAG: peptide ABC transporter substrate-binding protein [Clostridia bacterium]|nr:peptide ABC transporter substrate-binding protein [Clostridia bacterium]
MKKLICALLTAAMCATLFAGCSTLKGEEKGATINVYIGSEITDFDPALAYIDDSAVKVLGLVYEPLTRINAKGKVENALMKSYKTIENEEKNDYRMEITIKETKWSDGRAVTADDVVYAWKRILDPEFSCAAASLLFDIKNAFDVKMGDSSIDDLGLAAVDTDVIEVQFEGKVDYDLFLENLACLALVPLREDVVVRYENFGTKVSSMVSNGPFAVKGLSEGESLMLERNVYYYRDTDNDDALDKYVLPYRLVIDYTMSEDELTAAYENDEIYYLGDIALDKRADYEDDAEISDLLSTHSYIFNTTNELFASADVRNALSLALDREAIADIVTYAEAATGLIPDAVYDKKVGDSFRENGGDLIAVSADAAGAKSLLAGKSGSFTITCRSNAADIAIAEYCKDAWKALGFDVSIKKLDAADYMEAYVAGDYDVIAVDYQSLSTDAFGALAVFAPKYSGMGIDIQNDNYDPVPYIPGYANDDYSALIDSALAEKDREARSSILHDAEKLLMDDMAIMPIIYNQDAYVFNSKVLSKVKDYYMGYRNFNRLTMKNWRDYEETDGE